MNKAENFKNKWQSCRFLVGTVALNVCFSLNIASAQETDSATATVSDDYLSTVLNNTKGKVFRYKKMPVKVFIDSNQFEERAACEQAFFLWQHETDGLISFEKVCEKNVARVLIKFVSLPGPQEPLPNVTSDGGHTLMEWHFQKRLLRFAGRGKAYVPPQIVEVNLRSLDERSASQRKLVLRNVIAHELGHAVGLLGHSLERNDLMFSKTDENSKLSSRDLNTLRKLYRLKANVYL